jgi:hypothetical protein
MIKSLFFLSFLAIQICLVAQNDEKISFSLKILASDSVLIKENKITVINAKSDTIHINKLKFYLSGFKITDDKKKEKKSPENAYLIDLLSEKEFKFEMNFDKLINPKKLIFTLGIDSILNSSGVLGGALDPTKGMYWTWNSGYINMMIEGKSRICPTKSNQFQLHLGGFLYPNHSWQTITLDLTDSKKQTILFDVEKFFDFIQLEKNYKIMSPGFEAVEALKIAANCFSIQSK